jgi:mycothiol system anti-sigma-R factor
MAEVWTFLDGECTGPVQAEFCEHLSTCTECLDRYVLEGRVKRLIATKCGGDRAPDRIRWLS